jgi:hypothetical protein
MVFNLAKGKTCSPDGFLAEFFQRFWPIIKQDLMLVLENFYDNKVELWHLNKAHIEDPIA